MMWYGDNLGWGGWIVMTLGMLAFWAFVAWLVVYLVRSTDHDEPRSGAPAHTPEQILADRYARGEIDEGEYLRRLDVLRSGRASEHASSTPPT